MAQIVFLVVLITTIYIMITTKKKVSDQALEESLTKKEKLIIWLLCFLNPIIAGAIFYYGWKNKLPNKAKQANQISLWAFFIIIIIVFGSAILNS